jgi:hypothetical protein
MKEAPRLWKEALKDAIEEQRGQRVEFTGTEKIQPGGEVADKRWLEFYFADAPQSRGWATVDTYGNPGSLEVLEPERKRPPRPPSRPVKKKEE